MRGAAALRYEGRDGGAGRRRPMGSGGDSGVVRGAAGLRRRCARRCRSAGRRGSAEEVAAAAARPSLPRGRLKAPRRAGTVRRGAPGTGNVRPPPPPPGGGPRRPREALAGTAERPPSRLRSAAKTRAAAAAAPARCLLAGGRALRKGRSAPPPLRRSHRAERTLQTVPAPLSAASRRRSAPGRRPRCERESGAGAAGGEWPGR